MSKFKNHPILIPLILMVLMTMGSVITARVHNNASDYKVVSAMDRKIRAGVKAYRKGDFETAAMFMRTSLKESRSKPKQTKVHSNLCAIYAAMENTKRARDACSKALELSPAYAPALVNHQAMTIQYATTPILDHDY